MPGFAVKHIARDYGLLSEIMKDVIKIPYSFTSKLKEASAAANANFIYVIEVRVEKGIRSYWLGYKYRAFEYSESVSNGLWKGKFKYKNSAKPTGKAEGKYFTLPVRIEDISTVNWLKSKQPGMAEIPRDIVASLELVLTTPSNNAISF